MQRTNITEWVDNYTKAEVAEISSAFQFGIEENNNSNSLDASREAIAEILLNIKSDSVTVISAVLMIALESDQVSAKDIESHYSNDVYTLATDSLSLIKQESSWLANMEVDFPEQQSSEHHMMLLSMMKDVRAVFILLARQVVKMRSLSEFEEDIQKKVSHETQYIFAPLANRLGIGQLKWELEDLAFRYLDQPEYKRIAKALEERRIDREQYMTSFVQELQSSLDEAGLKVQVYGRAKHIFSIWKKLQKKDLDFSKLYDVRAVRVMADDLASCYTVLSIVHGLWKFIPSEYDDYIAAPKANNYQSLHTAVHGPQGKTVEIQIRTYDMHEHAELGVAAHWRYKEGGKRDKNLEGYLEALRLLLSDDAEKEKSEQPVNQRSNRIYVLTPRGNVIELPAGSTPLDFAYAIHTDIGHKCRGAKINGKMSPLTTELKSGQTVEVIASKTAKPSRDWLVPHFGYLKSSRAKSKVRTWFKREFREEHILQGKSALTKELGTLPSTSELNELSAKFNMSQPDDLFAAIGRGELGVNQVANVINPPEEETWEDSIDFHKATTKQHKHSDIYIKGVEDLMTNFARCCKPMAGDDVVGFITKGRGVTVHREDCSNVIDLKHHHPDRLVPVTWGYTSGENYEVDIQVTAMDRSGLLRDVTSVLSGAHVNVNSANTYSDRKTSQARMRLTIEISEPDQLSKVLAKLASLRGVLEASRIK